MPEIKTAGFELGDLTQGAAGRETESTEQRLRRVIGDDVAFIAFLEAFAGCRLYISKGPNPKIEDLIGKPAADRLRKEFGGEEPSIPLAKLFRARAYRARGESNAMIALRLGMTVKGVENFFRRNPTERPAIMNTRNGEQRSTNGKDRPA